jgi:hypothetical protein
MSDDGLPAAVPLRLRLQHFTEQLGPAGLAGAAALLAAAVLLAVTELLWQPALVDQRETLHEAQARVHSLRSRPPAPVPDDPERFAARLPPPGELPSLIEALHDDAARRGLKIDRGDYRVSREIGGLAQRHQISLPVRGDYARLQAWLRQALRQNRALAIDELTVRRGSDDAAQIESRVRFSLYTRSSP